jgi:UDP-N-acetylmuramoyl-tripeptide--D-alanyl-D-alanine ligase
MSVEQIAKATGGETVRVSSGGDLEVSSVSIDTRSSRPGGLFIPLPGTKTDGHVYISDASEKGAAAALVKRSKWREGPEGSGPLRPEMAVILVEDTLVALQTLANRYLSRFPELTRIGITGSNGKTTTKELVGSILSHHAPTMTSAGNYNSEIGVPLSVFEVEPEHRFAVFEMAMNHPGEMDTLADIVRPHAALITNIGTAHIEQMHSKKAIAKEKRKIFKHFSGQQKGFLCESEPFYNFLKR